MNRDDIDRFDPKDNAIYRDAIAVRRWWDPAAWLNTNIHAGALCLATDLRAQLRVARSIAQAIGHADALALIDANGDLLDRLVKETKRHEAQAIVDAAKAQLEASAIDCECGDPQPVNYGASGIVCGRCAEREEAVTS